MIGVAMKIFDAVGGWPGVFLIIGSIVGGGYALVTASNRREAIKELREKPPPRERARRTRERARGHRAGPLAGRDLPGTRSGAGAAFLGRLRRPLPGTGGCHRRPRPRSSRSDGVRRGPRKYHLFPSRIEFDTEAFDEFVVAYGRTLQKIHDGVLDKPAFAIVYEHRRSNEENRALYRALQRDLATVSETAQAALETSPEASDEARRAR